VRFELEKLRWRSYSNYNVRWPWLLLLGLSQYMGRGRGRDAIPSRAWKNRDDSEIVMYLGKHL